jgi:hypothetical protein
MTVRSVKAANVLRERAERVDYSAGATVIAATGPRASRRGAGLVKSRDVVYELVAQLVGDRVGLLRRR